MRVLIVAPSRSDNSLGRALSLAEAWAQLGAVSLLAADDGPLWPGAEPYGFDVAAIDGPVAVAEAIAGLGPEVVVAVKPFRRSLRWAVEALRRPGPGPCPLLVADLDDLDVAIHAGWHRDLPPRRRLRSLLRHELSPWRMRMRMRLLLPAADALTVSSWALRDRLPPFRGPELRIPHPRAARAYAPPAPSERLRVAFFGTPVSYKGLDIIMEVIRARPAAELHVLAGTEAAFAPLGPERLVVHPQRGSETLAAAFGEVDVVLLPQDPAQPAARYQLPAKLIDALRYGRPVVATDTPAIRELAGPSVSLVRSWSGLSEGLAALDGLADRERRERRGRAGAEAWARAFSTEALAPQLRALVDTVRPGRDTSA